MFSGPASEDYADSQGALDDMRRRAEQVQQELGPTTEAAADCVQAGLENIGRRLQGLRQRINRWTE
jgi:hypothetical protein